MVENADVSVDTESISNDASGKISKKFCFSIWSKSYIKEIEYTKGYSICNCVCL